MSETRDSRPTRAGAIFRSLTYFTVAVGVAYGLFVLWDIDFKAWFTAAGIFGVAVGFAAKDVLADLLAGVLILAYRPYEVHDWIVVGDNVRGEVTHIGLRSTRILTPDDVEISIRNGLLETRKIANETRAPFRRQRVRVAFVVAPGTDVDHVRALILAAIDGAAHILDQPERAAPGVSLCRLGGRGLELELSVWIDDPSVRELVVDDLSTRIHHGLTMAGIELPARRYDARVES